MNKNQAFTLIELMIVVVIISILAAIALPSYQAYIIKLESSAAQQELLRLSEQLERYKSRNFSYRGFNPQYLYNAASALSSLNYPSDAKKNYIITLADISISASKTLLSTDTGLGKKWAIKAIPTKTQRYALLLTSDGIKCKTKYLVANDLTSVNSYIGCGNNSEPW